MNDFYDADVFTGSAGTRARASQVSAVSEAVEDAFDLLPDEDDINMGLINYAVDSGAADAYIVTLPQEPTALTDGMQVVFKASAANTGACTINPDLLGAISIKRHDGTDPVAGDIGTNKITELRYNSTSATFEIQGSIGIAAGTGTMAAQNANAVAITGGTVTGLGTPLALASGGTAAASAAAALTSLGFTAVVAEVNTGCDGISDPPIAGDATPGRVLRASTLLIEDGLAATSLKMTLTSLFNGDAVTVQDSMTDGVTKEGLEFTQAVADSISIEVMNSALTGDCVQTLAVIVSSNATAVDITTYPVASASGIKFWIFKAPDRGNLTMTTLVDTGDIILTIIYLTDE